MLIEGWDNNQTNWPDALHWEEDNGKTEPKQESESKFKMLNNDQAENKGNNIEAEPKTSNIAQDKSEISTIMQGKLDGIDNSDRDEENSEKKLSSPNRWKEGGKPKSDWDYSAIIMGLLWGFKP